MIGKKDARLMTNLRKNNSLHMNVCKLNSYYVLYTYHTVPLWGNQVYALVIDTIKAASPSS